MERSDEKETVHPIPYKVENVLKCVEKMTLSSYPGSKVSWKIIEKNKNEYL